MLQQTQIDTALPYFRRWVARWPDWMSLAGANENEVQKMWSGLGYYQRCQRLLKLARVVEQEHNGNMPEEGEQLISLPGIGPYTSEAIAAIAFNRPAFPIDGNVRRVLSRFFAESSVSPSAVQDDFFKEQMLPEFKKTKLRRELAQALMELGALVCKPKKAHCDVCPLGSSCAAFKSDQVELLPNRKKRQKSSPLYLYFCWVFNEKGEVLLRQRQKKGRFAGLWEPPNVEESTSDEAESGLPELLQSEKTIPLESFRRDFTSYKVTWKPHILEVDEKYHLKSFTWINSIEVAGLNLVPVMHRHFEEMFPSGVLKLRV